MAADAPPPDDLDARLQRALARQPGLAGRTQDRSSAGGSPPTGWAFGLRVGADLIAGLLVGLGIGYGLDFWLGTRPWMMVLFLILGMGAGLMNVYRTIAGMGYAVGYRRPDAADTSRQEKDG